MESEPSGIFGVKLVAKNIVLGSPRTHFMHMRIKKSNDSYTIFFESIIAAFL